MIRKIFKEPSMMINEDNCKWIISCIVLVGLSLRIALAIRISGMTNDSVGYIMMANYLYNGQIADAVAIRPMYPMLYPLLLCSAKFLGLDIEKFGIFFSIITSTAVIYLVWLIAHKITNNIIVSLISASFVAVHPQFIYSSIEVLRDSPGLFFGLLTIYLILAAIEKSSYPCWVLAGFILVIASLFRLEYLGILLLVPCWAFFSFIFCKGERKNILLRYAPGFLILLSIFFLLFITFQNIFIEYGSSFCLPNISRLLSNFLGVGI